MTTVPLSESAFVTLDGSGNGTARVGPAAHGVVWRPTVASLKVSTSVQSPTCLIYAGSSATPDNFVDGTYTGSQNSTSNIDGQVLYLGQYVFAVWTGGDPGAQATIALSGTKDIP
jgi:hypothetical protein